MKITYTQFAPDPSLRGTTTHLPAHIAQVLIASGQAREVKLPPRGSAGWLEARNEQAALVTSPGLYDVVPPTVNGCEWSVKTQVSGQVNVIKKIDGQVFFFDGPPADCPPNVRQQYLDAANVNPGANTGALEAAKVAQYAQKEKEKVGVAARLWGGKV